ncbi:MAG: peptidoglycan DD-metalloendopeptidase family protein [Bacteroidaceae bacterium]|nr:peptidoglycan DD-metalloendopeptidase family protein [Bacteroidaceae bacterium]
MKNIFLLCLTCLFLLDASAQTNKKIQELENQRNELQQQIAESETLLRSTKKDVKSQLDNLALINGQIADRKKYIGAIERDVQSLNGEINTLQRQLNSLQRELKDKKKKYEASVQYMYRNKSIQEKLMFIFSAENLSQTYRRLRYVREYADFQRLQAVEIERKQKQVETKKAELELTRAAKEKLLKESEDEKKKLEKQEKEKQTILNGLKRKQRNIQSEINKKRRSADKLNARIDRLIEEEIEKARKRAEEQARKEGKAEGNKGKAKPDPKPAASTKPATKGTVDKFRMNTEDRQLSGSFEKNKGILPMPITGPYVIVGRYGQYAVTKNVRLDNKGIDIRGKEGAKARAVFDGEVSAIFQYNGLNNVLIRHGNYISVYCNLSTVSVTKGTKVKTRQEIGTVQKDASGNPVLHFQLRKETAKLNPEVWLGR